MYIKSREKNGEGQRGRTEQANGAELMDLGQE